jgi:uncharacterized protein
MGRVVHFEIVAKDAARSVAFYRDVFGWQVIEPEGDEQYWLFRTGGEGTEIDGGLMGSHFAQPVINTVEVEAIRAGLERVAANGGRVVLGPRLIPGVGNHAYCADPEGTLFGVLERLTV